MEGCPWDEMMGFDSLLLAAADDESEKVILVDHDVVYLNQRMRRGMSIMKMLGLKKDQ